MYQPEEGSLEELFARLHADLIPYYRSWAHDCPMIVTHERDRELMEIQRVLYKCCSFYAEHYRDYLDVIPYDDRILEILDYVSPRPFAAGTFRPDYLILDDGTIRLCEITSRFFGNGYFLSYFMEHAGRVFADEAGITDGVSYFEDFLKYMAGMPAGRKKLCVLKSADKSDSIRLYVPFYEALGMKTVILEAEDVEASLSELEGSMVVSALNQKDLLSFSADTLKALADSGMRNDFRTIFLLHDKRFFRLFFEDSFTDRCLSPEETAFLRAHTVETWLPGRNGEIWEDARKHRENYILKHHCLGKSEKVYAGCLTDPEEWEQLFTSGDVNEMILQPFMSQRIFPVIWKETRLDDYICGTILCVDDRYFGTGLFRTSTRPVINQTDAHKAAPVITDQLDKFPAYHLL